MSIFTRSTISSGRPIYWYTSLSLGTHDSKLDEFDRPGVPYLQHYIGGTDNRKAVVSYVCNKAGDNVPATTATPSNSISLVLEPVVHLYELTFSTPDACSAGAPAEQTPLDLLLTQKSQCIFLNTGWWTYKFCFFVDVEQLHRENVPDTHSPVVAGQQQKTKLATTQSYDLGSLSKDMSMVRLRELTKVHVGETAQETYVSQEYVGGTPCDLTNQSRKTEVRFFCDTSETQHNTFKQIKESATCEYVALIGTRSLCSHKLFKPAQAKVHKIVCSPTDILKSVAS